MSTVARYQYIQNTLGTAFTTANFNYTTDGDDRPFKVIKRELAAADIGTGSGQVRNASGAIVTVIPATTNVLWFLGFVTRPQTPVSGMTPYVNLQGLISPLPNPTNQENYQFGLGTDNTIRIIDAGGIAGVQLAAGDIVTILLLTGPPIDPADQMNG